MSSILTEETMAIESSHVRDGQLHGIQAWCRVGKDRVLDRAVQGPIVLKVPGPACWFLKEIWVRELHRQRSISRRRVRSEVRDRKAASPQIYQGEIVGVASISSSSLNKFMRLTDVSPASPDCLLLQRGHPSHHPAQSHMGQVP